MGKHPETVKPFLGLASRNNLQVSRIQATPRERRTLQNLLEDDHRPKVPSKVTSTEQGSMVGLEQEGWVGTPASQDARHGLFSCLQELLRSRRPISSF